MSNLTDYSEYQKSKWLSIYSAYIALQCHHYINIERKGMSLLAEDMKIIKQEAVEISDLGLKGEAP